MKYNCPVCGYPDLQEKPINHEICPSCGTQFGYEDFLRSHTDLRQEWLANGAKWFLEGYEPPYWNGYTQLENAGLIGLEETSKTQTTIGVANSNQAKFKMINSGSSYGKVKPVTNWRVYGTSAEGIGCKATL
jgi:hypothetical protein